MSVSDREEGCGGEGEVFPAEGVFGEEARLTEKRLKKAGSLWDFKGGEGL